MLEICLNHMPRLKKYIACCQFLAGKWCIRKLICYVGVSIPVYSIQDEYRIQLQIFWMGFELSISKLIEQSDVRHLLLSDVCFLASLTV